MVFSVFPATLTANLDAWGLESSGKGMPLPFSLHDKKLTHVHIEQTCKGSFHLFATIDATERKSFIAKNKDEHPFIESTGVMFLDKYLLR